MAVNVLGLTSLNALETSQNNTSIAAASTSAILTTSSQQEDATSFTLPTDQESGSVQTDDDDTGSSQTSVAHQKQTSSSKDDEDDSDSDQETDSSDSSTQALLVSQQTSGIQYWLQDPVMPATSSESTDLTSLDETSTAISSSTSADDTSATLGMFDWDLSQSMVTTDTTLPTWTPDATMVPLTQAEMAAAQLSYPMDVSLSSDSELTAALQPLTTDSASANTLDITAVTTATEGSSESQTVPVTQTLPNITTAVTKKTATGIVNQATQVKSATTNSSDAISSTPATGTASQTDSAQTASNALTQWSKNLSHQTDSQSSNATTDNQSQNAASSQWVSNTTVTASSTSTDFTTSSDSSMQSFGQKMVDLLQQQVTMQVSQNSQQATIRLDPPHLGQLDIAVKMEGDKLTVQINAEHAAVRESLQNSKEQLRQVLMPDHQGGVDVEIGDGSTTAQQQQQTFDLWNEDSVSAASLQNHEVVADSTSTSNTASSSSDWLNTVV